MEHLLNTTQFPTPSASSSLSLPPILAQAGGASQAPAGTAQPAVPAPTTGSPGHYKTKSALSGAGVGLALLVLAVILHKQIDRALRGSLTFRIIVLIFSPVMALILSGIASWEDIFKRATYDVTATSQPDWHTILWASIWSGGATLTILAAFFTFRFKEGEQLRSVKLEAELSNERVARTSVERQRELLTDITTFAMKIVTKKKDRIAALDRNSVTAAALLGALDPAKQIVLLVNLIHEFFMPDQVPVDFVLRLGLFARDPNDRTRLMTVHSWDGAKTDCFNPKSKEFLKLDNPQGSYSTIVRCFHSTEGFILVPDCHKAQADGKFTFFYPGQEKNVGSVVTYKHLFRNAAGEEDAMVVMLVASKPNYFTDKDREEIRQFLKEMLTRLELEWMISEALTKIEQPEKAT